jgi:uncharacterized protein (TIGR00730 family)
MEDQKIVNVPEKHLDGNPISHAEMQVATQDRIYEISREFTQGFKFLQNYPRSVTFFGSARLAETDPYYIAAFELAKQITTSLNYSVLSGGGPGIMEAANRGAIEGGGNSIGLTIRLPKEQIMNNYLTSHIDFYYFFSRKVCLAFSAEAFVFFPGGYGTLDEFFEIITLLQTKKIPSVPVILVGKDYWQEVYSFIENTLLKRGTIDRSDLELFHITDDTEEILTIIKNAEIRDTVPYKGLRVNPIDGE